MCWTDEVARAAAAEGAVTGGAGKGAWGAGGGGAAGGAGGCSFARTREKEIAAQKTEGAEVETGISNVRGVLSATQRAKRTATRCM